MSLNSAVSSDDAQRRAALDPTRSFIVQAPAGSGKTELLIQRYLRLLATVNEPEEIIAITFTRKAATEMRSRVLKALRETACNAEPGSPHARRTRELARAALMRDLERGWGLPENPARLRIQTIDALCARLSRHMPLLSRFGAQLEPVDDATELYREAARALLAELDGESPWTPALEVLLHHLDNDLGKIERLLADMLARREQWLRHIAGHQTDAARRAELERGLCNVVREALGDVIAALPTDWHEELARLARYAAGNLRQNRSNSRILACEKLERLPGAEPGDLEVWLGLAELLLKEDGKWRKGCNALIGFPPGEKKDSVCKQYKQAFLALLEECRAHGNLLACLAALRTLPAICYSDAQWQIMQALFELLPVAAAQLELTFQARAQMDFAGVARRAQDALGSPDAPTDLALMLDYRIRHLLIDEFQDTSHGQASLLEGLTAGWTDGDGRTLFAVGDPMQSIYGFREAEVGVFLKIRRQGLGDIRPAALALSSNFRSEPGVVSWINDAFARVFPADEHIGAGAVAYTRCQAMREMAAQGAAVRVHCFIGRDPAAEAARVVELVAAARREDSAGNIAILVRGKAHLAEIAPRLKAAGLKFRAVEIEQLGHRPVVQDLLALTRALCHLADRLAWLAVLRAPWCGLSLQDLHALAGDDLQAPLWNLITDDERCSRLGPDGQTRLSRVRAVLTESLKHRRRRTLRRQIEGAWLALGGPATVESPAELENAHMYFALLARLEQGGDLADFTALMDGVDALFAAPDADADARLQLMTIHKAKGLEFETVIVPGLGCAPKRDEHQLLAWLERVNREGGTDLLIAPIAARGADEKDVIYAAIRGMIAAKTQHEDERLLYVAATRARRRLHLLGHATLNKAGDCKAASRSLLARLWPVVERDFAAAAARSQTSADAERAPMITPIIRRFAADWRLPAPPEDAPMAEPQQAIDTLDAAVEFAWVGETARHVGVVTHRLLQRIGREGVMHWNAARIAALRPANLAALSGLGVPAEELEAAAARVEQALLNTLKDARGRWLFAAGHAGARTEYALTGVLEGRLVNIKIDRTFVDANGTRWIVDYKTGTHEGSDIEIFLRREEARYRPQLARYAALLGLTEARPIRAGLYYPLIDGGWREWSVK
jgi:ATP-dependent helicase/nuclease subunit A